MTISVHIDQDRQPLLDTSLISVTPSMRTYNSRRKIEIQSTQDYQTRGAETGNENKVRHE